MKGLTITLEDDMADEFMLAMLRNAGDTAIWCIRKSHKYLSEGGGPSNWTDIADNLKILDAVNTLLEYYGNEALDLATHETQEPV